MGFVQMRTAAEAQRSVAELSGKQVRTVSQHLVYACKLCTAAS